METDTRGGEADAQASGGPWVVVLRERARGRGLIPGRPAGWPTDHRNDQSGRRHAACSKVRARGTAAAEEEEEEA